MLVSPTAAAMRADFRDLERDSGGQSEALLDWTVACRALPPPPPRARRGWAGGFRVAVRAAGGSWVGVPSAVDRGWCACLWRGSCQFRPLRDWELLPGLARTWPILSFSEAGAALIPFTKESDAHSFVLELRRFGYRQSLFHSCRTPRMFLGASRFVGTRVAHIR